LKRNKNGSRTTTLQTRGEGERGNGSNVQELVSTSSPARNQGGERGERFQKKKRGVGRRRKTAAAIKFRKEKGTVVRGEDPSISETCKRKMEACGTYECPQN